MTEIPTIQEAFEELICQNRAVMTLDEAYEAACIDFVRIYKLQPPYVSSDSYRVAAGKKVRVRKL